MMQHDNLINMPKISNMQFDQLAHAIPYQTLHLYGTEVTVKRLDLVHPEISGNKFYKLKYNLLEAQRLGFRKVLSFGGAYSNHIAATAYAAHYFGFDSIGIIRGEELAHQPLNKTLTTAQHFSMQLKFISRAEYRLKQQPNFLTQLKEEFPDYYIIPEGGTNAFAVQGCQEILNASDLENFDVICCAVGTGGTLAGLIEASSAQQHLIGFSALKGDFLNTTIQQWTTKRNWHILDDFCCGGYAKTTPELCAFIQHFEQQHLLPLEQVYTAKMMLGISSLIQQKYFKPHAKILVIHTGGLQGKSNY